jgi:hypothetical protein
MLLLGHCNLLRIPGETTLRVNSVGLSAARHAPIKDLKWDFKIWERPPVFRQKNEWGFRFPPNPQPMSRRVGSQSFAEARGLINEGIPLSTISYRTQRPISTITTLNDQMRSERLFAVPELSQVSPFFLFDDAFRRVATYYFAKIDEAAWGMFFRARRRSDVILASSYSLNQFLSCNFGFAIGPLQAFLVDVVRLPHGKTLAPWMA